VPRPRGNARKRKARLTDQTFTAVVAGERPEAAVAAPDGVEGAAPHVEETSGIDDLLELLRTVPDAPTLPASYNDPNHILRDAKGFPASRYVIGLLQCSECHNEIIYYQRREVLEAGFQFRCRFCQHELVATLP